LACPTTVHETVCVQANVRIEPQVEVGTITSSCCGNPFIGSCPGTPVRFCEFMVSQNICVQVPLTFHANATATPSGIVCGTPDIGGCPETTCTFTIGYYKNHPDVTNALITDAGGSIILGIDAIGLSVTATTANANDILNLMPPPPAPDTPPYDGQYEVLYAQLLAANLNVLRGATCEFAVSAIAAANTFIANSPPGGMMGAGTVQEPLATFNEGMAGGCPVHCPE